MRQTTLIALVAAGAVAVLGGWYFGTATKPDQQRAMETGALMFPDLVKTLPSAAKIEVVRKGATTVLALKDGQWGLADRGGYRVQDGKLRGMLTALTELRLTEPRTADAAQFARLGVEDAEPADSNSTRLRLLDAAGKPFVDLIVGHRRVRTQGKVPEQVYVRRPGDAQSWLAEGSLQVDADPGQWFDRDLMNINHDRIASVTVTRGGQTLELAREGTKLVLKAPAEQAKLDEYRLDDVARALEQLTLQEVKPGTEAIGEPVGSAVFTADDGLRVTASVFRADKDVWARFAVAGDGKSKDEAERLSARVGGWTYQLGSWKEKALVPSLDDLKAPEAAAPAADAPAVEEPAKP